MMSAGRAGGSYHTAYPVYQINLFKLFIIEGVELWAVE